MVRKCWEIKKNKTVDLPKVNIIIDKINSSNDSDAGSHADPIRKKIKYGTTSQAIKGIFLEYFNESSIHGFKYLGNQRSKSIDRIIWLCALALSICTCFYLISNIWDKRNSTPVIVTFNSKPTPVWEIPFPSVTICPETKAHTHIFNFTDIYWKIYDHENITKTDDYYWEAISQICRPMAYTYGNDLANGTDILQALMKSALKLDETLLVCTWKDDQETCEPYFDLVFTAEGICFTFNAINAEYYRDELRQVFDYDVKDVSQDWLLDSGYNVSADLNTYPKRVIGTGEKEGLTVFLADNNKDRDMMCRLAVQGFKLIFHTPGEEPQVSKSYISISLDQSVSISIKPEIVTTSKNLRQYDPKIRQCYFQDERYLRYYNLYTQANCELECLANRTLEDCGCVKFSMPRNTSHPVCGAYRMECLSDVERDLFKTKFDQRDQVAQLGNSSWCNCLPNCVSIRYKAELEHQINLDYVETLRIFKEDSIVEDNPGIHFTQVLISFKEEAFSALQRSELYSKTDFIANCGGLLGLFMGISILSLVELVYFITIRLWTNLQTRRRKRHELRKFKATA